MTHPSPILRCLFATLCFALAATALPAQQLLIDRGVQAAGLWCFPVYGDTLTYYYLPSRGRLGTTPDSLPEFSFLRYVTEAPRRVMPRPWPRRAAAASSTFWCFTIHRRIR